MFWPLIQIINDSIFLLELKMFGPLLTGGFLFIELKYWRNDSTNEFDCFAKY